MLAFIKNNGGASDSDIKAFMFVRFGLKHGTTATYIKEAHLARLITSTETAKWIVTRNYNKLTKYLY